MLGYRFGFNSQFSRNFDEILWFLYVRNVFFSYGKNEPEIKCMNENTTQECSTMAIYFENIYGSLLELHIGY